MAERYSRIYTLPGNLYSDNAPVLIVAGALLKDNQTGKMLAQLKMQNLDARTITGISLSFVLFDADGKQLGESFTYQFNRISVEENSYFGQKEPVILPVGDIYSYQVSIQNVILSDGKVWEPEKDWNPLPADVNITDVKQTLCELRQKEAEEKQRELEELEQLKAKRREEQAAEKKKKQKKTIIVVTSILFALFAVFSLLNMISDSQTKKDLLPDLLSSSWQHHSYYEDVDWDFKFTLIFIDEENMTIVSETEQKKSQKGPQKTESECTWRFSSISSEKANISVKRSDGKSSKYTVYFEIKNGELEISKIVDHGQYSDSVYYRK